MYFKKIDIKNIGKKIKEIRINKLNITQEQFASKCGVTVKTISEIELNKTVPTVITLGKICKVLDVRVEKILY